MKAVEQSLERIQEAANAKLFQVIMERVVVILSE
jgi:hypothetical protein